MDRLRTLTPAGLEESGQPRRSLAEALLETDRQYFEAGSRLEAVGNGVVCWMPSLERVPAGCVCQRIDLAGAPTGSGVGDAWLDRVEACFGRIGTPLARLYVEAGDALDEVLARRGYRSRIEHGYLREFDRTSPPPAAESGTIQVALRELRHPDDWAAKERLHGVTSMGPDGYPCDAGEWVELERAKCAAGRLRCYLIECGGTVCGAVGTMRLDRLLRIKNFVIHPDHRGRGIGLAAVQAVVGLAREGDAEAVGVFGIDGEAGSALYQRAGFAVGTRQTEWTKPLEENQKL